MYMLNERTSLYFMYNLLKKHYSTCIWAFHIVVIFATTHLPLHTVDCLYLCCSKSSDDKMLTYKNMASFASDEKDLKTFILDDLKVKQVRKSIWLKIILRGLFDGAFVYYKCNVLFCIYCWYYMYYYIVRYR